MSRTNPTAEGQAEDSIILKDSVYEKGGVYVKHKKAGGPPEASIATEMSLSQGKSVDSPLEKATLLGSLEPVVN